MKETVAVVFVAATLFLGGAVGSVGDNRVGKSEGYREVRSC